MKNLKHKTLALFPTAAEAEPFITAGSEGADVAIIGVGPIEAAVNTLEALRRNGGGYSKVILAGIAGRYPGSTLTEGDVVLVAEETDADCGSFSGGTFSPIFAKSIKCPYIPSDSVLRKVRSNSVGAAGTPFVERGAEQRRGAVDRSAERQGEACSGGAECGVEYGPAEIENMEGAAFFRACLCSLAGGVEFLEIRAISNIVGEDISKWNIPLALKNLTEELNALCFLSASELSEHEPDAVKKCDINLPVFKNDLNET